MKIITIKKQNIMKTFTRSFLESIFHELERDNDSTSFEEFQEECPVGYYYEENGKSWFKIYSNDDHDEILLYYFDGSDLFDEFENKVY